MSLLVVGTVAFDTVETPFGQVDRVLGGSASYFSCAASFFTPVRLVSIVGSDFPKEHVAFLQQHRVDTAGLANADGKTFHWTGRYQGDMNEAETLAVQLNVYGDFRPHVPKTFTDSRFVFLANGSPESQMSVLDQMQQPEFVVADTMNLWIKNTLDPLKKLLRRIDALVLNEGEAKMLSGERNLVAAAEHVLSLGPRIVIVKKGEYGAFLVTREGARFALPAYPVAKVKDPTGAGDSFAGGVMGFLAQQERHDDATLRRAMVYGTVMASFVVEDFSLDAFRKLSDAKLRERYDQFVRFVTI